MKYFWFLLELFYAWRRNERRIAPVGVRGRVYQRKDGDKTGPSSIIARAQPSAYIEAKIIRADGRVEDLGVIASAEVERT